MRFTEEQRKIIAAKEKHIKILAVAGSGKTTTIMEKLKGEIPGDVLLFSFTVEMAKALSEKSGGDHPAFTFHAFAFKIFKEYEKEDWYPLSGLEEKIVLKKAQKIAGIKTQKECKNILKEFYLMDRDICKDWVSFIADNPILDDMDKITFGGRAEKFLKAFFSILNSHNLITYALMEKFIVQYAKDHDLGYGVVYVDEAQDCNAMQFEFIRSQNWRTVVIGDKAQELYSFNGCDYKHLEEYDATEYYLSKSFRCTTQMLPFIKLAISKTGIKKYGDFLVDKDGPEVEEIICSPYDVGEAISKHMSTLPQEEIAESYVLARTNRQVGDIKASIGSVHKIKLYDHTVWRSDTLVKFALLLRVKQNLWQLNDKKVFLSAIGIDFDEDVSTEEDYDRILDPYYQILKIKDLEIKANNFYSKLYKGKNRTEIEPALDAIHAVYEKGIDTDMKFLEFISDSKESDTGIGVMTVHQAKGREADTVYVVRHGLPSRFGSKEEEFRVLYVALTRAKNRLVIVKEK